ncbi:hypothetical protein Peur_040853 [Populus x canadensis]
MHLILQCQAWGYCLSPVPLPGSIWVEITYASPYGPECLKPGRNSFPASEASGFSEHKCGGAFVLFGDLISMAHSVKLTAYQPCWAYAFSVHLPNALEKSSACTFHVSLTLAILNSLPVYFLDGESILEVALCHFTSLSPRKRVKEVTGLSYNPIIHRMSATLLWTPYGLQKYKL